MTRVFSPSTATKSLVDILGWRGVHQAEAVAYTFLLDDESRAPIELTFTELDRAARALAAVISRSCAPGDRALLLFPSGA